MEFKEQKCPECGGILQVPEELNTLNCMYCGKELKVADLLDVSGMDCSKIALLEEEINKIQDKKGEEVVLKCKELLEADQFHYIANYIVAYNELPGILRKHKDLMRQFKSKLYGEAMKSYIEESRTVLTCLERACLVKDDKRDEILKECTMYFIQCIKEDIGTSKGKADDCKMVLALFAIPMILEQHLDISEALADYIIEEWIREFPKNILRKGNFEQINHGFRKKGLCYITTAVCETLHKPDDCYELVMFRTFRDNFLLNQPDGKILVEEYYNIAPKIVENISKRKDKEEIYQSIWQNYLKGCLCAVEDGEDEKCKKQYKIMVRDLQMRYLRQEEI